MRNLILFSLGLFLSPLLYGQTSLASIGLDYGSYGVGFQHYIQIDSSRMYRIHNEKNRQWG